MSVQSPHSSIWEISPPQEESRWGSLMDPKVGLSTAYLNRSVFYMPFLVAKEEWMNLQKGDNNMAENKSLFYDAKEVMEMLDL